jgi:type II secretory pathway component PulK
MTRKRTRWPRMYAFFPVGSADEQGSKNDSIRGVALMIAIMVVVIVFTFTTDLVISSRVAVESSMRHRDNVKAEFMAKSALNLALFVLSIDYGVDKFRASDKVPKEFQSKMTDTSGDIWAMINGIPIGGGTVEMLAASQKSFDLSNTTDDKVMSTLKLFDGEFVLNVEDEGAKININTCTHVRCLEVLSMLQLLFTCPAEKEFLRSKNIDPKQLAYRIKDFVDTGVDADPESGANDEDSAYEKHQPPYSAKNMSMDSPSELRMIEGWDDEVDAVFGPYITTYPVPVNRDSKTLVNLNTASKELLGCLFPESQGECSEKFALGMKKRNADKESLAEDPTGIGKTLQDKFCYTPSSGGEGGTGADRTQWFDIRSSVFKVIAKGEVGEQTKTISAIVERIDPDIEKKQTRSWRLLRWRLQ